MITRNVYYYTLTGKTEAALELIDKSKVQIHRLNDINPVDFKFSDDKLIVIGSPTYGRGAPPLYFKEIIGEIRKLRGRKIGLFGSGNTIYGEDYCGALDVLEELMGDKNEVVFKYKFEGYPRLEQMTLLKELFNRRW